MMKKLMIGAGLIMVVKLFCAFIYQGIEDFIFVLEVKVNCALTASQLTRYLPHRKVFIAILNEEMTGNL